MDATILLNFIFQPLGEEHSASLMNLAAPGVVRTLKAATVLGLSSKDLDWNNLNTISVPSAGNLQVPAFTGQEWDVNPAVLSTSPILPYLASHTTASAFRNMGSWPLDALTGAGITEDNVVTALFNTINRANLRFDMPLLLNQIDGLSIVAPTMMAGHNSITLIKTALLKHVSNILYAVWPNFKSSFTEVDPATGFVTPWYTLPTYKIVNGVHYTMTPIKDAADRQRVILKIASALGSVVADDLITTVIKDYVKQMIVDLVRMLNDVSGFPKFHEFQRPYINDNTFLINKNINYGKETFFWNCEESLL